jgi:hypothetical protein
LILVVLEQVYGLGRQWKYVWSPSSLIKLVAIKPILITIHGHNLPLMGWLLGGNQIF